MRRRISVAGAALSLAALSIGAVASAANASAVTKITCHNETGIAIGPGAVAVVPNAVQGLEYGPAHCGAPLGRGVQTVSFRVPISGNRVGEFQTYFAAGSLQGKYTLVPQTGTFDATSFSTTHYLGVMKITGGTGAFANAKGTGKMTCRSIDGIHTTCTNKLSLTQL